MVIPEVEVTEMAVRRQFSAEYKRTILTEADACTREGAIGALLRREGLYSSHLAVWRAALKRSAIAGLAPKKRGPKAVPFDPRDRKIVELERETRRLTSRLERAEALALTYKAPRHKKAAHDAMVRNRPRERSVPPPGRPAMRNSRNVRPFR
jgi:transposase-like protein